MGHSLAGRSRRRRGNFAGQIAGSNAWSAARLRFTFPVINYREERFEGVVRKITRKEGVDVVFEHVGPDTFAQSMFAMKRARATAA